MARSPRFAFNLTEDGIVRLVKTSGEPITPEEVQFFRDITRDALRAAGLAKSATHIKAAELKGQSPDGVGETRGGVRFEIDPAVIELEAIGRRRGIPLAHVARAMFSQPGQFYDWVRGASRPQMFNLRTWAALHNRALMLVPTDLLPKVKEMIAAWENENEHADEEAA